MIYHLHGICFENNLPLCLAAMSAAGIFEELRNDCQKNNATNPTSPKTRWLLGFVQGCMIVQEYFVTRDTDLLKQAIASLLDVTLDSDDEEADETCSWFLLNQVLHMQRVDERSEIPTNVLDILAYQTTMRVAMQGPMYESSHLESNEFLSNWIDDQLLLLEDLLRKNNVQDAIYRYFKARRQNILLQEQEAHCRALEKALPNATAPEVDEIDEVEVRLRLARLRILISMEDGYSNESLSTGLSLCSRYLDLAPDSSVQRSQICLAMSGLHRRQALLLNRAEDAEAAVTAAQSGQRSCGKSGLQILAGLESELRAFGVLSSINKSVEGLRKVLQLTEEKVDLCKDLEDAMTPLLVLLADICQSIIDTGFGGCNEALQSLPGRLSPLKASYDKHYALTITALTSASALLDVSLAEEAIEHGNKAFELGRTDSDTQMIKICIARACILKYDWFFDVQDLRKAVELLQGADPHDRSLCQKDVLYYLSTAYTRLYMHTHDLGDIQQAIDYATQGERIPGFSIRNAQLRSARGEAYFVRGTLERIEVDVAAGLKALASAAESSFSVFPKINFLTRSISPPYPPAELVDKRAQSMGKRLKDLFVSEGPNYFSDECEILIAVTAVDRKLRKDGVVEDVEKSLQTVIASTDRQPHSHPLTSLLYRVKVDVAYGRYKKSGEDPDFKEYNDLITQAVNMIPPTSLDRPRILMHNCIRLRQEADHHELYEANLKRLLNEKVLHPLWRFDALNLMVEYYENRNLERCAEAFERAVQLLRRRNSRLRLTSIDMFDAESTFSGFSSEAAARSLQAGFEAARALTTLENGRAIPYRWLLTGRNDLSLLAQVNPQAAATYLELRGSISKTSYLFRKVVKALAPLLFMEEDGEGSELSTTLSTQSQAHRIAPLLGQNKAYRDGPLGLLADRDLPHALLKMEVLESTVGASIGESNPFRDDLTLAEILALADPIPIVEINAQPLRSDVFVIDKAQVRSLLLPVETYDRLLDIAEIFATKEEWHNDSRARYGANIRLREHLKWVYAEIVLPVMTVLNISASTSPSQRLLWIANGISAMCPFHAAGTFEGGALDYTAAHVISSYSSSLIALKYARQRPFSLNLNGRSEILVATMPKTPAMGDISAQQEAQCIVDAFRDFAQPAVEIIENPSRRQIVDALSRVSVAHFACHGVSSSLDPFQSHLKLRELVHSGTSTPLSVYELTGVHHNNLQFAYLSACSTAHSNANLIDNDGLHLVAAFQLAGFKHVVGSLWEADNDNALMIAKYFYEELTSALRMSGNGSHDDLIAIALHNGVAKLRRQRSPGSRFDPALDVLGWAPFVHFGA